MMMTMEELHELSRLRIEIKNDKEALAKLEAQGPCITVDSVKASYHDFPYSQHTLKIEGIDVKSEYYYSHRRKKRMEFYKQHIEQEEQLEEKLMEFIDTVNNSTIRSILKLHYLEGYSWTNTALKLQMDVSYPQKLLQKFFEKN